MHTEAYSHDQLSNPINLVALQTMWKGMAQHALIEIYNKHDQSKHAVTHKKPKEQVVFSKGFKDGQCILVGMTTLVSIVKTDPAKSVLKSTEL